MARVTGKANIVFNGQTMKTLAGASLQTGGITREPVVSDQGTVDYREVFTQSEMSGTIVHDAATSMDEIRASAGVTVNFETDSGVVFTVSQAFVATLGPLSGGTFDVTLNGPPALEQLP